MYKSALRAVPRNSLPSRALNASSRRFLSTAPPTEKRRSWKSSAARWGLAAAGIYYYNTSNVFAEEPEAAVQRLEQSIHAVQESNLPTIDAIVEEKRQRRAEVAAEELKRQRAEKAALAGAEQIEEEEEGEDGLEGLEEEAEQQGAFNPETGEINWDCPCLGGMAHGPCGDEFKAAFSCFVYSTDEPKGIECIDKFKGMQDCFRQHPEMYASELEDDEDEVEEELRARESAESEPSPDKTSPESSPRSSSPPATNEVEQPHRDGTGSDESEVKGGKQADELLPRAAFDASSK